LLVGQGLAFIDYSQPAAENWSLHRTDAGRAAAVDMDVNPDDPSGYLRLLMADVAAIRTTAELTRRRPSTRTNARLYHASAIMLGVASEAAVLEVATALTTLMIEAERRKNVCSLCPEELLSQNDPGKESCLTTPSIGSACIHPQRPLTAAG
jgi:hypothetical protein